MNTFVAMGVFSFAVALISLLRLLAEREFFRVRLMKRVFGRKNGLALHFVANVAAPLVVGLIFFCGGVSDRNPAPLIVENPLPDRYQDTTPVDQNDAEVDVFSFVS